MTVTPTPTPAAGAPPTSGRTRTLTAADAARTAACQHQLRLRLRQLRSDAGLTRPQVAGPLGWSQSKLLRIETGQVGVSLTDLRAMLELYRADPGPAPAGDPPPARLHRTGRRRAVPLAAAVDQPASPPAAPPAAPACPRSGEPMWTRT